MCGIAGILHLDKERCISMNLLKKMTDVLNHRGSDGEGYYLKNNLGLGHKRLSIIDLATGQQPMISDDGKYSLLFKTRDEKDLAEKVLYLINNKFYREKLINDAHNWALNEYSIQKYITRLEKIYLDVN